MVDVVDDGRAAGNEPREEDGRAGAHIEGAGARPVEGGRAADDRGGAGADDLGAHLAELVDVEHAVVEDALVDDGNAVGLGQQRGHGGVQVGGEARVGKRLETDWR